MKLVADWKKAHTWLSIKFSVLGVSATSLWLFLPGLQSSISNDLMSKITLGLFGLIAIGRVIDQSKEQK